MANRQDETERELVVPVLFFEKKIRGRKSLHVPMDKEEFGVCVERGTHFIPSSVDQFGLQTC